MINNIDTSADKDGISHRKMCAKLEEQNRIIRSYHAKWEAYDSMKTVFERLLVPGIGNQEENIRDIHACLDELENLYLEIGYIGESGEFDIEEYQFVLLDRKIREGKIKRLSQVPEDFRHTFEGYFSDEIEELSQEDNDFRSSSDIGELIDEQRDILSQYFEEEYPFCCFLRKNKSPEVEALVDKLNDLWNDYKKLVIDVAYHF